MNSYGTRLQILVDLRAIFDRFPLANLLHLRENRHRLMRGAYRGPKGHGCIIYLLSELFPVDQRIDSREKLKQFFGQPAYDGEDVVEKPCYQPARWIVRIWDKEPHPERYGTSEPLREQTLLAVLNQVIAERETLQASSEERRKCSQSARRNLRAFHKSAEYVARNGRQPVVSEAV